MPLCIREVIAKKQRARSQWQRSRNPIDKNTYNRLAKQPTRELQEIQNKSFKTYITSLSKDDHSRGQPLRKPDGIDQEKANVIADYLTDYQHSLLNLLQITKLKTLKLSSTFHVQ